MKLLNSHILAILFAAPAVFASGTPSNIEVPMEFGNPSLAALGFVDVTAAPFSADPRGKRDSTEALQHAIVFARDHQWVCFFPPGEYKVSDTLNCEQFRPLRRDGKRQGTRDYPCVLRGSQRAGERPRIVLASRSEGFSDPEKPKYVVHFWAPGAGTETPVDQPQPNISMNQMLVGIDVIIGRGNAGAVGIRHRARPRIGNPGLHDRRDTWLLWSGRRCRIRRQSCQRHRDWWSDWHGHATDPAGPDADGLYAHRTDRNRSDLQQPTVALCRWAPRGDRRFWPSNSD